MKWEHALRDIIQILLIASPQERPATIAMWLYTAIGIRHFGKIFRTFTHFVLTFQSVVIRRVKLVTVIHLVPTLRMRDAVCTLLPVSRSMQIDNSMTTLTENFHGNHQCFETEEGRWVWIRLLPLLQLYTGFWWGNLMERDYLEDPGVDGRIMLRWIFR